MAHGYGKYSYGNYWNSTAPPEPNMEEYATSAAIVILSFLLIVACCIGILFIQDHGRWRQLTDDPDSDRVATGRKWRENVKNNLIVKDWADVECNDNDNGCTSSVKNTSQECCEENTEVSEQSEDAENPCDNAPDGDVDDSSTPCCSICLDPFENGNSVCQSNNEQCKHVFHEVCMRQWLMTHCRCPVCRQCYLVDHTAAKQVKSRNAPSQSADEIP